MPSSEEPTSSKRTSTATNYKPQPPSFANLQPPTSKQQGLGIGRDSSTAAFQPNSPEVEASRGPGIGGKGRFGTECKREYMASINCRLEHHDHKVTGVCNPFYETYKACRIEEDERRKEANAAGGSLF